MYALLHFSLNYAPLSIVFNVCKHYFFKKNKSYWKSMDVLQWEKNHKSTVFLKNDKQFYLKAFIVIFFLPSIHILKEENNLCSLNWNFQFAKYIFSSSEDLHRKQVKLGLGLVLLSIQNHLTLEVLFSLYCCNFYWGARNVCLCIGYDTAGIITFLKKFLYQQFHGAKLTSQLIQTWVQWLMYTQRTDFWLNS